MTYPKLELVTKWSTLTFPKAIAAISFLDLHDLRERERERERERKREREAGIINFLQGRLITPKLSFFISQLLHRGKIHSFYLPFSKKASIFCANNLWNVQEVIRKSMLESKRWFQVSVTLA